MTGPYVNPAETLRDPASAMAPDPRTGLFAGQAALSLAAHHADIATVQISPAVPEPIAIQFETARNLYLYAWHVYRFYMVAATHALTTLEFGLGRGTGKDLATVGGAIAGGVIGAKVGRDRFRRKVCSAAKAPPVRLPQRIGMSPTPFGASPTAFRWSPSPARR